MKVRDIKKILADEQSILLIDNETLEDIVDSIDECLDLEVLEIRAENDSCVAVYVSRPIRRWGSWLDVTYTIRIEADVPMGKEPYKVLEKAAIKELDMLPKKVSFGGGEWLLDYNNIESGAFFDMIAEEYREEK